MKNMMIIDGHNLLFRMYYGIPNPIKNSSGQDIRGVIGFVGGMLKLVNMDSFDKLIIVFDSETSIDERIVEDSNYKQNRIDYSKVPDEDNPFVQLDYIYRVLEYLKVDFIEAQGHEADDYIASLCSCYKDKYNITIVSTDRDFLQLVDEKVFVYSPRGKLSILFTPDKVKEKFNINPSQIIDYKILVGDNSDNISGVKSIGPKTAVKILNNGTLSEILEGKEQIEEKLLCKLIRNKEVIDRNRKLIKMKDDIELNIDNLDLSIKFDKNEKAMRIIKECGLT